MVYICKTIGIEFVEKEIESELEDSAYCIVGELEDIAIQEEFLTKGCISLLNILSAKVWKKNLVVSE